MQSLIGTLPNIVASAQVVVQFLIMKSAIEIAGADLQLPSRRG
jgi:hypothetical protein